MTADIFRETLLNAETPQVMQAYIALNKSERLLELLLHERETQGYSSELFSKINEARNQVTYKYCDLVAAHRSTAKN